MNATKARIESITSFIKAALKPAGELKMVKAFYYYPNGVNGENEQLFNKINITGFEGLQDDLEKSLNNHKPGGMICESEMPLKVSQHQNLSYMGSPLIAGETILSIEECILQIESLLSSMRIAGKSMCNANKINREKCFVIEDKVYFTNSDGEIRLIGDLFSEK